jgi:hypothetical protein
MSAAESKQAPDLSFPIMSDETATSYASRLSGYCGLGSPSDLSLDLGFRWQDFIRGDETCMLRLAQVTGINKETLLAQAIRTIARGRFLVSGQVCARGVFVRSRLRVCPRCLVADHEQDGRLGRYRRPIWQFTSIRSCPIHHVPLIALPAEKYTINNYDFLNQTEKHIGRIHQAADRDDSLAFTALEAYLEQRLKGQKANAFLDAMPIHLAMRLCEMLGFVLAFGPERLVSEASDADMSVAGERGFQALQFGEEGLFRALDTLVSPISRRTVRHQKDFGAFFEWLRNASLGSQFENLKDKVRAYIFRNYPFREGDTVLGKPSPSPVVYSINGACRQLKMERQRMNRFLLETGEAVVDPTAQEVWLKDKISAAELGRIKCEMSGRLSVEAAAQALRISIDLLAELRGAGHLAPVTDALDQRPKFRQVELEAFAAGLLPDAEDPAPVATDTVSLVSAAMRVRCRSVDIVELVQAGRLKTYDLGGERKGFDRVGVSLAELKIVLPPWEMAALPKGDAARRLRVNYQTIIYLAQHGMLTLQRLRNPKSRQFLEAVTETSLAQFESTFVTLGQLARLNRRASGPLKSQLEAKGICPAGVPAGISCYYDRYSTGFRLKQFGLALPDRPE